MILGNEPGRRYIDEAGRFYDKVVLCVSPLEAIEGKQVKCENVGELNTIKKALGWTNFNVIGDFFPHYINKHLQSASVFDEDEVVLFSDFIKITNNPPIEAPKPKPEYMNAEDLRGKWVKLGPIAEGSEYLVAAIKPETNTICTAQGWHDVSRVGKYLNDQGEWADPVKEIKK
jgi:hypothetical protein